MVIGPILTDTNIISTFARIDDINFLFESTKRETIYISPNVLIELENAKELGYKFVEVIFKLINDKQIKVLSLSEDETTFTLQLPQSFGSGERDSLAICKFRKGILLSNERKVFNYCQREDLHCLDLPTLLRYSWKEGLRSKEDIKDLIDTIEKKDNIKFKNRSNIMDD